MSKVTLNDVVNLRNPTTSQVTINSNSSTIETAFDNTLSRDGTSPNTMSASLDMNLNRILNLPLPISLSEPARLADLQTVVNSGTNLTVVGNLNVGGSTKIGVTPVSAATNPLNPINTALMAHEALRVEGTNNNVNVNDGLYTADDALSYYRLDILPTSNETLGNSARNVLLAEGHIPIGANTVLSTIYGLQGVVYSQSAGLVSSMNGVIGATEIDAGTVSKMRGVWGHLDINAGTVTDAIGVDSQVNINAASTTTNVYGVRAVLHNIGGTITNRYGAYLDVPTGAATNDWGFYQAGTQKNSFGGDVFSGGGLVSATVAVASLPAAAVGNKGMRMMVNNATATTFWSIVAAGGANIVPVTSDGTNWRIG